MVGNTLAKYVGIKNASTNKYKKLGVPIGTTLDRYIKFKQDEVDTPTSGDFSQLLRDIALAGKIIHQEVSHAGMLDISGDIGKKNIHGEKQKKLDLIAHIRFLRSLKNGGVTAAIISEEMPKIIDLNRNSQYVVCIDPLDGSSNIDVNVSIGTIFSIYKRISPVGKKAIKKDFLQPGCNQLASGYILYGFSSMLVLTTGKGVHGFTLEPSIGEFLLSHEPMCTPKDGKIYSINDGLWNDIDDSVKEMICEYREKKFSSRYIGSLVADFHRNLLKGGIYIYPPTLKKTKGKLRLLYECNALSFIVEQAGGLATNGKKRILDLIPQKLHERTPLFIGSKNLVNKI